MCILHCRQIRIVAWTWLREVLGGTADGCTAAVVSGWGVGRML